LVSTTRLSGAVIIAKRLTSTYYRKSGDMAGRVVLVAEKRCGTIERVPSPPAPARTGSHS
jgi:hypothetical protein